MSFYIVLTLIILLIFRIKINKFRDLWKYVIAHIVVLYLFFNSNYI